jgi:hypothetical protein
MIVSPDRGEIALAVVAAHGTNPQALECKPRERRLVSRDVLTDTMFALPGLTLE